MLGGVVEVQLTNRPFRLATQEYGTQTKTSD
jgi:hypothetical protein